MTLQTEVNRTPNWFPNFSHKSTQQTPPFELPSIGKISFLTLLLIWGLNSLIQGIIYLLRNIPGNLEFLNTPNVARDFIWQIMFLPFGLSLTILVADYSLSGRLRNRHWYELLVTIVTGAISRSTRPLFDLALWLQGGISWARLSLWASYPQNIVYTIIVQGYIIILLVLCLYFFRRILNGMGILTSNTFLLLSINYLWVGLQTLWYSQLLPGLNQNLSPISTQVWYIQASIILEVGANLLFAFFLLRMYLSVRYLNLNTISVPLYFRGFFFFYGVFSIFYRLISYSIFSMNGGYGPLLTAAGIIGDGAIALVAIYPPRIRVKDVEQIGR